MGRSLPAWGAWIEISASTLKFFSRIVAPRMGSVDWNLRMSMCAFAWAFAPRMGSVDWNRHSHAPSHCLALAPRMGSVDWNYMQTLMGDITDSLPAWGAWIEIWWPGGDSWLPVAPRMGSVDWNIHTFMLTCCEDSRSPHGERGLKLQVQNIFQYLPSRSPHGERGLKSGFEWLRDFLVLSLPAWGAWIEISSATIL